MIGRASKHLEFFFIQIAHVKMKKKTQKRRKRVVGESGRRKERIQDTNDHSVQTSLRKIKTNDKVVGGVKQRFEKKQQERKKDIPSFFVYLKC